MRGSVHFRRGRWRVDSQQNLGTLVSQQIILDELQDFLARHYSKDRSGEVLDLGAGTKPYAPVYEGHFRNATAIDVPHSPHDIGGVDLHASADSLPFEDGSFNCVICTEVLEHCADPGAVMNEIARVLKKGGNVFLTTPFLVPLHEMPHDYYRFTPSALEHLAGSAGLSVASIRPRGGYVAVALRTFQMPITKIWQRLGKLLRLPLYHRYNPVVYLTVVLPERLYLLSRRHGGGQKEGPLAAVRARLTYYTLGYVTELRKP